MGEDVTFGDDAAGGGEQVLCMENTTGGGAENFKENTNISTRRTLPRLMDQQCAAHDIRSVTANKLRCVEAINFVCVVCIWNGCEALAGAERFFVRAVIAGVELDLEVEVVTVEVDGTRHRHMRSEVCREQTSRHGHACRAQVPRLRPGGVAATCRGEDFKPHVVLPIGHARP